MANCKTAIKNEPEYNDLLNACQVVTICRVAVPRFPHRPTIILGWILIISRIRLFMTRLN